MNGDTAVTYDDVRELVEQVLGTQLGDANLDGIRNADDEVIVLGDHQCCWCRVQRRRKLRLGRRRFQL